jgi:ABC-type glutathione transport system ATPase component
MISSEPPDFFSRRKSMSVLLEKQWQSHFPEKDISEHKTAIRHIVHMLELPLSHLHKMPSECTRDEILRFSLARAFLLEAKVILFDDPIRDFSIPAQEEIFSLLLQRQDEIPITYVYATICSDIIQEICTDFAFLEKGRIIQE